MCGSEKVVIGSVLEGMKGSVVVLNATGTGAVKDVGAPPVDAGAGDTERNAQVDAGPPRLRLPAVTAVLVPSD